MEPQSKESKRDPTIGSSEGNDEKDNECCAKAEGGEEAEDAKTEQAENEMEQSEAESEEKSLQMIREDFEQMRAVYAYRLAKNAGKSGADLYPQGYSSVEKRALRRYANKYLLEGKSNEYNTFIIRSRKKFQLLASNQDFSSLSAKRNIKIIR